MNRDIVNILLIVPMVLFLLGSSSSAQTLFGVPGLITAPTADFNRDGVFSIGGSFISKERLSYSNYQHDGMVIFTSLTFLPYVEVSLKFTKQLGRPASTGHTMDRSPSIRLKLLREQQKFPAIVLGMHDLFSTVSDGHARHFGATYLVVTKHFFIDGFMIVPSAGYGFKILEGKEKDLVGLFGGVQVRNIYVRPVAMLIDYDTEYLNVGFNIQAARFVNLKIGLTDFQYFVACAGMHFNLFDVF